MTCISFTTVRRAGVPNDSMKYRAVFAQGRGVTWDQATTLNAKQGIELTTAVEWIRQNLGARSS